MGAHFSFLAIVSSIVPGVRPGALIRSRTAKHETNLAGLQRAVGTPASLTKSSGLQEPPQLDDSNKNDLHSITCWDPAR
jgi:hypothetical protein